MTSYQEIALDGIWRNNPALVQMLGLCPLLAVSSHLVTALGLGIITLLVLLSSNFLISLIRTHLHEQVRLPIQILIIASSVTLADLCLQAYFYELHQRIGLFVALIVTNCTILGRAELLASRSPVKYALLDGIMMGLGFLLVLVVLGSLREIIGQGTLFAHMDMILGDQAKTLTLHIHDFPVLLAALPPGAFLLFGCIIAFKNYLELRHERRKTLPVSQQITP
ncbi:MAG TPA: electron transport complex subunit E [Gammaproteobacteria bacterium]|nr:electron transport complex subunit E [Gammaproteobacteria bacterium]HIK70236.1 electron transport complex subunit E [Pseudomonadales bacterium]